MAKRVQSGRQKEEMKSGTQRRMAMAFRWVQFRTARVLGVNWAGSDSWRLRARWLVGSAARRLDGRQLTGPAAEAPKVNLRRSARSDHGTELAARSPGGADANSSFFCRWKWKFPQKKLLRKKTFLVRGCVIELPHLTPRVLIAQRVTGPQSD